MKLSIVTINYNNREGLIRTLKSTAMQTCRDFEHILVDGASTDGSVEVIREYASGRENVKWISEPDSGIYNAMNKGTRMASGEYLLFLNSGDDLCSNVVVGEFVNSKLNSSIICGGVILIDPKNGRRVRKHIQTNHISLLDLLYESLPHQGSFIQRNLLINNPYNEQYKIVSDTYFFIEELIMKNSSFDVLDFDVANFYLDGISVKEFCVLKDECDKMRRVFFPPRVLSDYEGITPDGHRMLQRLCKYSGFRKFVVKMCLFLIDLYELLTKLKSIPTRGNNR